MNLISKIDEALKTKPSFVQYFFNKKNYKRFVKEFSELHNQFAMEYGNDVLDDERYYSEEEREEMEISPDEAYDNYAHSMGYMAEWDTAHELILNHKNKYDYQRGDETDSNEYTSEFIEYLGWSTSFVSYRRSKRKEDYWKMAEQE